MTKSKYGALAMYEDVKISNVKYEDVYSSSHKFNSNSYLEFNNLYKEYYEHKH